MDVHVAADAPFRKHVALVRTVARRAARMLFAGDAQVAIRLMDDEEIRELNTAFRKKSEPTDVLSFEGEGPYVGDVALCVTVAERQALELGHSLATELAVLTVHALVHLCGLDHERSAQEARLQAEIEMGVLDVLGVPVDAALSRRGL